MIDTQAYVNDVELSKQLLENTEKNNGRLSNSDVVFALRNILKMKYYPVAVKYFFDQKEPLNFYDFDGYRLEYNDWWFNVRPSNTEPYLRLVVEAKNQTILDEKLAEIKEVMAVE